MLDIFKDIEAVGFDLDGTLYKTTKEIDERIGTLVALKILERKPELGDANAAKSYYHKKRKELESSTKTLIEAGYSPPDAVRTMKKCLEEADISDLLIRDDELIKILDRVKDKYYSYLITKSPRDAAIKKLSGLGIKEKEFDFTAYGDTPNFIGKPKTAALKVMLKESSISPEKHVYVGDRKGDDILDPKSLGMKTISVWSKIDEADVSIANIKDIEKVLL